MERKYLRYFFILLSLLLFISCAELSQIKINEIRKNSLAADEYDFYKLTLPPEIDRNSQLIFELDADTEYDTKYGMKSDPNMYISVDEINPTYLKHTWSCTRFGNEIIALNGPYLFPFQYFHIGIHCKEKCNYIFRISTVKKINIPEGIINSFTIERNSNIYFSFLSREYYKELKLYIYGSFNSDFTTKLVQVSQFSAFSLAPEPILFNGYKYSIMNPINNNETKKFELTVENRNEKQEIDIFIQYDDEPIRLKEAELLYDVIAEKKANCYYYSIDKINQNKDIIISATLINGMGFLYISGFTRPESIKINENYIKKEDSYAIIQNKAIILTKDDLQSYGKYEEFGETQLYFCFYAQKDASLSIKAYLMENFKRIQGLNYILPGIKIEDFLPKKSLTRYRMEHFNVDNDLSVYLRPKSGKANLYVYMMSKDRNNDLLDYENFQPFKKANIIYPSQQYLQGYYLYLTKELNICLKGDAVNKNLCFLNAIVECEPDEDCTYELYFDHSKVTKILEPKEIFTNVISQFEVDTYAIDLREPGIKNVAIVLTPITGKTNLTFDSFITESKEYDSSSYEIKNTEFIPGIIKFSHKTFDLENLMGVINFSVKGLTYATYSIYYYTYDENEDVEKIDHNSIQMKLEKGVIIKDIFMDNIKFKVYMYDSLTNLKKSDLFISLIETDRINIELYVFKDLKDISIISGKITGYLWFGDYNDFIYVDKDDPNYKNNDIFYILIYKKTEGFINEVTTFYLGVTDESTPFILTEGVEFKHQLDTKHSTQKFFYYYKNDLGDSERFLKISLSLFKGHIIVEVKIKDIVYTQVNVIEDSQLITIPKIQLFRICQDYYKCPVTIQVTNDNEYLHYSSFLIAVKTTQNIPINLKQGIVSKREILNGEEQHFIVDLKPDTSFGAKISAFFTKGQGELYVRKLLKSEIYDIVDFPDENNYEYKATYNSDKSNFYLIEIPYEELSDLVPCKILLTVKGVLPESFDTTKIEYSISISNNLYELVTEKNYKFFISQGEISYFHFKVEGDKKRLYISMTNKEKDANMYLNYEAYVPSISEHDWENVGGLNEYLDISVEDPYFTSRQMEDIDGEYYLAIRGLGDSFYNLYISTLDVKIMTLSKGSPAGCICEKENDFCYFRYENINDPQMRDIFDQQLIFYTEFTYGSGSIFGKLYPNGNMEDIVKSLPTVTDNDYKGKDIDEFLYVYLNKNNPKYTFSSVVVVGVQCQKKSLFDMSVAPLDRTSDLTINDDNFIYLEINEDNIYYLGSNTGKSNKFVYFMNKEEDFNFQVKALIGNAQIHIYTNRTLINPVPIENYNNDYNTKENENNYHHISNYIIDSNKEDNKIFYGNVPKKYCQGNYFVLEVKPIDNTLININVHYDVEMDEIALNKELTGIIKSNNYYAYFDLLTDIDEYIITVTSLEKNKNMQVYIKSNIIRKDEKNSIDEQSKYSKPSNKNYDVKGSTNALTSAVSLRIKNIDKNLRADSIVRVLINIESEYNNNGKIKIMVSPVKSNISRMRPQQRVYYFAGMERKYTDKTLFMLRNTNKENDLMVIEISACKGNFLYNLVDSPPGDLESYNQLNRRSINSQVYILNGKKIIIARNIEAKEYYLMVYGSQIEDLDLFIDDEKEKEEIKKENTELLFYYYTTTSKNFNYLVTTDLINYKSQDDYYNIKFILPELKKRDAFGRENYIDYINYTLIVSESKKDFMYMGSTCYLTKLQQKKTHEYDYLTTKYDKNKNIINAKGFKAGKNYYINILAKNEYTGEIITYRPINIKTSYVVRGFRTFIVVFLVIIFIVFAIATFTIYRKYRIEVSKMSNYEIDSSSGSSLSKKLGKIKNIIKKKYNTLSEDNKSLNY